MAVEVAALITAAKAAAGLVQGVSEAVEKIRSGRFTNNDEAKRELQEKIGALQQSVRAAGSLAGFGREYAGLQEDVADLLWEAERVRASLRENREAAAAATHPRYTDVWETIDQLFESVKQRQGPLWLALDDRIGWLNETDRAQIRQRMQDGAVAIEGASTAIRLKASSDADAHLRRIVEELRRVQTALNQTLRTGIFGELQELSR
jgi:hypothetical protein